MDSPEGCRENAVPMKRPAIFFDRDNTLIVSDGYLGDPNGVVLVDGAADAVARARQYGYRVVTISNQSGVARGMFDEEAVQAVNRRMDELLQQVNPQAIIDHHAYCPFHPEATVEKYRQDSFLRKPKPGMILEAAEKLNLDLGRSWVIGDAPRDIEAGKAAGCRTVLFRDPKLSASPATDAPSEVKPDFEVSCLRDAVETIARESLSRPVSRPSATEQPPMNQDTRPNQPAPVETASFSPQIQSLVHPAPAPDLPKSPPAEPRAATRMESVLEQILVELKRRREEPNGDFSVSKLLAGIAQIMAIGVAFLAYLNRGDAASGQLTLLYALFLQVLTVALLIMGRQR